MKCDSRMSNMPGFYGNLLLSFWTLKMHTFYYESFTRKYCYHFCIWMVKLNIYYRYIKYTLKRVWLILYLYVVGDHVRYQSSSRFRSEPLLWVPLSSLSFYNWRRNRIRNNRSAFCICHQFRHSRSHGIPVPEIINKWNIRTGTGNERNKTDHVRTNPFIEDMSLVLIFRTQNSSEFEYGNTEISLLDTIATKSVHMSQHVSTC